MSAAHFSDDIPDVELAARVRSGDVAAFEVLHVRYYAGLHRFAERYVDSPDVASDVVSGVFIDVWRRRSEWICAHGVRAYLFGAVRNRALGWQRDRHRAVEWQTVAAREGESLGTGAAQTLPDEAMERIERAERLWRAVDTLPELRRTALTLRWRQGMPFDEIAAVMNTTPASVQMHISRALKMLRERLPRDVL